MSDSGRQSTLGRFGGTMRDRLRRMFGGIREQVQSRIDDIAPEWLGARQADLGPGIEDDVYRTQFVVAYKYDAGPPDESIEAEAQFKTILYTLGEPSGALPRMRETDNPRLRTMFNTGPYGKAALGGGYRGASPDADGYMSGFRFYEKEIRIEGPETVGRSAVPDTGLGVPRFEVEVYNEDGILSGHAYGSYFPYERIPGESYTVLEGRPEPGGEKWKVLGYDTSEERYEIGPVGGSGGQSVPARERLKRMAREGESKTVYINGFPIGKPQQTRGTVRFKKEFERPWQAKWTDRATIIEETGTPPQALQHSNTPERGASLWKVRETADSIILSTKRPRGFDPVDPDSVDPEGFGQEMVRYSDPDEIDYADDTQFTVEEDERDIRHMGFYSEGVTRSIETGTEFV